MNSDIKEALELADDIISYVGFDSWEMLKEREK